MKTKPVEEGTSVVEEDVSAVEAKATTKKAPAKRKKAAPESRPAAKRKPAAKKPIAKKTAEPVEPLPTAEELATEFKENLTETKDKLVGDLVEPAKKVVATWTVFAEMAKELAGGIWGGFFGSKKRED